MKVFLTGANGFIGLPTIRELTQKGHHVFALTRSQAGADKILSTYPSSKDITIVSGSTDHYDLITAYAARCDGVIHLAYNHDFLGTDRATAAKQDDAVLDAIFLGLRQDTTAEKPLIVASGCAGLRPPSLLRAGLATVEPLKEADDFVKTNARVQTNEKVVNAHGIRGIVMRLPPTVHGRGDPNFVTLLRKAMIRNQRAAYLSEGTNRWPATHVDDTARALTLALEKGERGYLHPIAEEGVAFKHIAKALADSLGLQAESVEEDEFERLYGWIGPLLSQDWPTNGNRTQQALDWIPREIGLLEDIRRNY